MNNYQLLSIYAFILIAMGLSWFQKLRLERDLLIGTVRATIQLLVVGYILNLVFALKSWPFILLMLLVMITVAANNVAGRGKGLPGIFPRAFISLTLTELTGMGLLLVLRIIAPTPQYIIPVSGMIVGNAMVACGLLVNRLRGEARARRREVLTALSLGASSSQAAAGMLRQSIRASSIPIVDNLKTVGLVQLPGMMTGMIVAGASPLEAVRYQLMVMFTLTVGTSLCSIILGYLVYGFFFTPAHQLRQEILGEDG